VGGAGEPRAGTNGPEQEGEGEDDAGGDGGVVERLCVDGVHLREGRNDRDEADPEHSDGRDRAREPAQVEWSSHESVRVDNAEGDGHTYRA